MNERDLAKYYSGGRVAIGVLMMLFPGRMMRDVLGGSDRRAKTAGRMIGVRDALLGVGGLVALEEAPNGARVRPWMTYAAISDAADALALVLAWKEMPRWKRGFLVLFALAGTGTGGYLVTRIDD